MLEGIDVSGHQGYDPPWGESELVGIKATEGRGWVSAHHARQVTGARTAGARVLHYHYSWPVNGGEADAANYVAKVSPLLEPTDGLVLDLEWGKDQPDYSPEEIQSYMAEWLRAVRAALPGRRVWLYTYVWLWNTYVGRDLGGFDALWVAHYGVPAGRPGISERWHGHQWTETGGPGGGPLDRNVWDFETLDAYDGWATGRTNDGGGNGVTLSTRNRTTWRGVPVDERTAAMLAEIALRTPDMPTITPTQGSWRPTTNYSADTHGGAGAVDLSVHNLTQAQQSEVEKLARRVGFAAWIRPAISGLWVRHLHLIAVPPSGNRANDGNLSPGAFNQVRDYYAGRNGLANRGADTGPRTYVGTTWESYERNWDTMATAAEVEAAAYRAAVRAVNDVLSAPVDATAPEGLHVRQSWRANVRGLQDRAEAALVLLRAALGDRDGDPIDASAVADALAPVIREAIAGAAVTVSPGDSDEIAAAVLEGLRSIVLVPQDTRPAQTEEVTA